MPGWRETLWDAQGALEIKYNVWVAQFEVHYKKAIWIANEATHICMLIRAVSSLVGRLLLMARNVHIALLRDCFCIYYQLCPTDHFPKQTRNERSKGDSKIKIIDWRSLDFRISLDKAQTKSWYYNWLCLSWQLDCSGLAIYLCLCSLDIKNVIKMVKWSDQK